MSGRETDGTAIMVPPAMILQRVTPMFHNGSTPRKCRCNPNPRADQVPQGREASVGLNGMEKPQLLRVHLQEAPPS